MRLRTIAIATLILAATASLAIACSVPVFRYALEHWQPDPYVVYVFKDEDLTTDQQSAVDSKQSNVAIQTGAANLLVKVVDVHDEHDAVTKQIWQDHTSQSLPWMVVMSPPKWGPSQTTWQGEFTADHAAMIVDSPARTQIGRRLIEGESVVWVLLESGRKEEDDKAFDTLTTELKKLETKIKLPDIEEADLRDLSVAPDALKIAFSAIRISRDDPNENILAEMLLRIEPDLLEEPQVSQPMAFPIFGRGRASYALVGKGIAPDVIEEACVFLTGGCQCTVKAQNPGVDLILNVDWDKMVVPTEPKDEDLPPLAGFAGFGQPEDGGTRTPDSATRSQADAPEAVVAKADQNELSETDAALETIDSQPSAGIGKNVLYVLMSLVVVVVLATFYFMPRTN